MITLASVARQPKPWRKGPRKEELSKKIRGMIRAIKRMISAL